MLFGLGSFYIITDFASLFGHLVSLCIFVIPLLWFFFLSQLLFSVCFILFLFYFYASLWSLFVSLQCVLLFFFVVLFKHFQFLCFYSWLASTFGGKKNKFYCIFSIVTLFVVLCPFIVFLHLVSSSSSSFFLLFCIQLQSFYYLYLLELFYYIW